MTTTTVGETYLALIRRFPLRPIRDEPAYEAASQLLTELAVRGEADLNGDETDYLDALTLLIEDYQERTTQSPGDASPLSILHHLMDTHGKRIADLAAMLTISEADAQSVFSGDLPLTADHARALGRAFDIDPGLFI